MCIIRAYNYVTNSHSVRTYLTSDISYYQLLHVVIPASQTNTKLFLRSLYGHCSSGLLSCHWHPCYRISIFTRCIGNCFYFQITFHNRAVICYITADFLSAFEKTEFPKFNLACTLPTPTTLVTHIYENADYFFTSFKVTINSEPMDC